MRLGTIDIGNRPDPFDHHPSRDCISVFPSSKELGADFFEF